MSEQAVNLSEPFRALPPDRLSSFLDRKLVDWADGVSFLHDPLSGVGGPTDSVVVRHASLLLKASTHISRRLNPDHTLGPYSLRVNRDVFLSEEEGWLEMLDQKQDGNWEFSHLGKKIYQEPVTAAKKAGVILLLALSRPVTWRRDDSETERQSYLTRSRRDRAN